MTDTTTRIVRAYQELQEARAAVKAAGVDVPMALDSAYSVYAHALTKLGMSGADLAPAYGSVPAVRQMFQFRSKDPGIRAQMAMDAAANGAGSFASRYPNAAPARSV